MRGDPTEARRLRNRINMMAKQLRRKFSLVMERLVDVFTATGTPIKIVPNYYTWSYL